jgi:hypothetical protein
LVLVLVSVSVSDGFGFGFGLFSELDSFLNEGLVSALVLELVSVLMYRLASAFCSFRTAPAPVARCSQFAPSSRLSRRSLRRRT